MLFRRSSRPSGNCKPGLRISCLVTGLIALPWQLALFLTFTIPAVANPFVTIVDPSFYRVPLSDPIQGTTFTVWAYYRIDGDNLIPARKGDFPDADRLLIKKQTLARARIILKEVVTRPIRDRDGTIAALVLESPDPTLSSVLLVPEFSQQFGDILGPDCLVAIPNRRTLFLFPRLAGRIQSFAETVFSFFHNDPWPVSTEIFALRNGILTVTDHFNDDF
jgi:hypothetical protein